MTEGLNNGVLTAMETGSLNLRGTELVVLSACNTDLGDVKNDEGVFGCAAPCRRPERSQF